MTKIAVLTNSSSYLTAEELKALNITTLNDPIMMGSKQFFEGVSWASQAEFYQFQKEADPALTTSQIAPGVIEQKLTDLAEAGYTDVIFVAISSGISGLVSTLTAMADAAPVKLHVWDSKIAAKAAGNQAKLAAILVQAGKSVSEIWEQLTILRTSTDVRFVVDDVRHLQRTGRLSNGAALVGSLLNIKPMLTFNEEAKIVAIGKERQMKRAWNNIQKVLAEELARVTYPIRVTIVDGNNPALADAWAKELAASQPSLIVERSIIGPYIGVHTGEKAMGVIWARDYESLL
ncbi:DegV family protein [Weissella muntiaci]|uniref:DegV family protein n=1 Tax=Weissella muntiaci TaxID=2508881 RepID=A0A6C2C8D7_9LACO|nr:DegV family protein [Weissella muntiaci]TYC50157.1 DegV family protein [Weissella muntiaci]